MRRCGRLLALALAGASLSEGARAGDEPCEPHYIAAQKAQRGGKLRAARDELAACLRVCSQSFATDCAEWLTEVEKAMPSVVLRARRGGDELVEVRVWLDGKLLAERLDGRAIELDPGEHAFELEQMGARRRLDVLIRQGEKNRLLEVELPAPPPPPAVSSSAPVVTPPPPLPEPPPPAPRRELPLTLAAAGGAALVAGAAVGYLAYSHAGQMREGCAPRCASDEVQRLRSELLLGDVLLGAGALTLAGAAYFAWWAPPPTEAKAERKRAAVPLAAAGGAVLATGAAVGYLAHARATQMREGCAPRCASDEVQRLRSELLLGDVLLGAGALTLAGAAYFAWWAPPAGGTTLQVGLRSVSVGGPF